WPRCGWCWFPTRLRWCCCSRWLQSSAAISPTERCSGAGLCGVSQAFGICWFCAALGAGPISVVSPPTAILVAAIPVGVGLALGERPGALAAIGVVLALVAVVLVSREATDEDVTSHKFTKKVAWMTVGSGVAFGLNFVL